MILGPSVRPELDNSFFPNREVLEVAGPFRNMEAVVLLEPSSSPEVDGGEGCLSAC